MTTLHLGEQVTQIRSASAVLDYDQAFQRNLGLINEEEQKVLRNACVAVAGAGGVGGVHLLTLARMGIGKFHIADFDTFDTPNINRQVGATVDTLGRPKVEVMREMLLAINPEIQVRLFPEGIQPKNIGEFLEGVDVVVDGIDFFAYDTRRMLFAEARRRGQYVLTSGPIGFGATLQIFSPTGMSCDDFFGLRDGMSDFEKFVAFATGIAPAVLHLQYMDMSKISLSGSRGPVVASSCMLCSGLIGTETVNILLKRRPVIAVPHYFQFDAFLHVYKKGYLPMGAKNPLQFIKRWILRRMMKSMGAKK